MGYFLLFFYKPERSEKYSAHLLIKIRLGILMKVYFIEFVTCLYACLVCSKRLAGLYDNQSFIFILGV